MNAKLDLIDYRRAKARETLDDAKLLADADRLASAVNRIYYALFYEVNSILALKDLNSTKHSGVMALFNEHFVKTGIVPLQEGRFYSRMFEFRQKSDYADFVSFEKDMVNRWLVGAERFFAEIEAVINKELKRLRKPG